MPTLCQELDLCQKEIHRKPALKTFLIVAHESINMLIGLTFSHIDDSDHLSKISTRILSLLKS